MRCLYLPLFFLSAGLLIAQAPVQPQKTPPSEIPPSTTAPAQNVNTVNEVAVGPSSGLLESNTFLEMSNRVFNTDSDSIDFENGSFNWKGKSFDIGNSRVFKARFERYLNTPVPDDISSYDQIIAEVIQKLSVNNDGRVDSNIVDAWTKLFEAGEFDFDGTNSVVIANMVNTAWRIKAENRDLKIANEELDTLRRYQQSVVASRQKALQNLTEERAKDRAKGRDTGENYKSETILSEADFRAQDLAETTGLLSLLESKTINNGLQAKFQFQSMIVNFFMQRRFQHCIIACSFYRHIFRGSEQRLEVGEKQLQEMFPDSNFLATVETLEFLSNEALADVRSGMAAIEQSYQLGQGLSALERLQETFFLGQHAGEVVEFDFDKKQQLLRLYQDMEAAKQLADLKDFEGVERILEDIAPLASDFPKRQVISSVSSAKRASNLSLLAAQQAMVTGDTVRGQALLKEAIEAWPLNPAVNEFTQEMADLVDGKVKSTRVFDDLWERKEYREIYNRSLELGAALAQDPERSAIVREVAEKILRIDGYIAQSHEMVAQENPHAAWEILITAAEIYPDDPMLTRAQVQLAPRVATYLAKLDKALRAEKAEEWATSLIHYLAVQEEYPHSRLARIGIERASSEVMKNERGRL